MRKPARPDVSLRDANARRDAAGAAPLYKESDLTDPSMAEARRAITLILGRHEPFPAFLTDRCWNVLAANDAAQRLLRLMLGEARVMRPLNLMRLFLAPDELRRHMVNWPAVVPTLLRRARREAMGAPRDAALGRLVRELSAYDGVGALEAMDGDPPPGPLCEIRFGSQGRELGLIGTVAAFAAPLDLTIEDLRVEAFLPADDESEAMLRALAGEGVVAREDS